MISLLLLATLGSWGSSAGPQFAGSACPSPSFSAPALAPPSASAAPTYVVTKHRVRYKGYSVIVKGWQPQPGGAVSWDSRDPWNAEVIQSVSRLAAAEKPKTGDIRNYGVDTSRRTKAEETIVAASAEAKEFVAEAKERAEADGKLHVTIIGPGGDAVKHAIATDPAFAGLRDHLLVQSYLPTDWAVQPFPAETTKGAPSIVVQTSRGPGDAKGGKVIYRASDYSMGAAGLAEAIRKADPSYRPSLDPGPATGKPEPSSDYPVDPVLIVVFLAAGALFFAPRKARS